MCLMQGWVIIHDTVPLIELARTLATRLKWDARVVEIESNNDERLLICQKPFFKRQTSWFWVFQKETEKLDHSIGIHFAMLLMIIRLHHRMEDSKIFEQTERGKQNTEERNQTTFQWIPHKSCEAVRFT